MDVDDADSSSKGKATDRLLRTISDPGGKGSKIGPKITPVSGWTPKERKDLPPGVTLVSLFRYHMGIDHDESLVPSHLASKSAIDPIATGKNEGRRAVNLGIYNRCIREERGTSMSYSIWSVVINSALALQIVFAAFLTALGAGNGPHWIVAIFGTLNTIIAGFLTFLKGTGLPMRMKYFHNQWLKLRAYIEQRERDFASDDFSQIHRIGYAELMEEIDIIEKMYHNIRKDVEKHTPEAFGGKNDNSAAEAPGEGAPEASLAARGLNAMKAKIAGGAASFADDLESRVGGRHRAEQPSSKYGGTDMKQNGSTGKLDRIDSAADGEDDDSDGTGGDVTEVALERMRVIQARTEAAQEQAEAKVKELEAKLAALTKSEKKEGEEEGG